MGFISGNWTKTWGTKTLIVIKNKSLHVFVFYSACLSLSLKFASGVLTIPGFVGRHKAAIEVYEDAAKLTSKEDESTGSGKDWEIAHNQGICHIYLAAQGNKQNYDLAKSCLKQAISCSKHDLSFTMLAKVYLMEGKKQQSWHFRRNKN